MLKDETVIMIVPDDIVEPAVTLNDQFFDLRGLSAYSSLGIPTLRSHLKSGKLGYYKVKGKILVRRSEFDAWIESFRMDTKQDLTNIIDGVMESLKRPKSDM